MSLFKIEKNKKIKKSGIYYKIFDELNHVFLVPPFFFNLVPPIDKRQLPIVLDNAMRGHRIKVYGKKATYPAGFHCFRSLEHARTYRHIVLHGKGLIYRIKIKPADVLVSGTCFFGFSVIVVDKITVLKKVEEDEEDDDKYEDEYEYEDEDENEERKK
jgi:hypothetical protein